MMGLNKNEGLITLLILIVACALTTTSQSIVTTSLQQYMIDFGVSSATAQWTYSVFLLVMGVMIPPTAYITKRFSIKTILIASLSVFLLGSIISYFSSGIEILIIGRIMQAMGVGVLTPITQIVIFKVLPEEKWSFFMGLFGFIIGIVPAMGPTIGGIIIDMFNWRMIYFIFTLLSAIILITALLFVKLELDTENYPLDLPSLVLSILFCVGIMLGFSNIAEYGFDLIYVIFPIVLGVILLIVFVKRQKELQKPLINLHVVKNEYFTYGTIFAAILYFIMCGINVMMPLFVQNTVGFSPTMSGLILLPAAVIMIVFNFVGPLLSEKFGIRPVLLASTILTLIGFISMTTYDMNSSFNFMLITQIIRGIGFGLGLTPAITWTMSVVVKEVEDATAINNTTRQIVGAIGSSITVVVMQILANGHITNNQISVKAFNLTSWMMILLVIILMVIVVFFIKNKKDIELD